MAGLVSSSSSCVRASPATSATPSRARILPSRTSLSFNPLATLPARPRAFSLQDLRIASSSTTFLEGEDFGGLRKYLHITSFKRPRKACGPRAASDDVPTFKGYPAMTKRPRWWWRVLACIPYLMPLNEVWMYAETAYSLHSFLEDYEFCTYPFLSFIGKLPSWFLLAYFFGAYLGIVRNNRWPHFLRFHVVTGMLLEILVQVVGTVNDWVPQSLYWGKLGAHYWLVLAFTFLFTVVECIRCALCGMYADVPFISDASYMQIPYDT